MASMAGYGGYPAPKDEVTVTKSGDNRVLILVPVPGRLARAHTTLDRAEELYRKLGEVLGHGGS